MSSRVLGRTGSRAGALPAWASVLAVVAHPDDESFALGAVLNAFAQGGSRVELLCFTHGEASTLKDVPGDLALLREAELREAADALGVAHTTLRDHPDGALDQFSTLLAAEIGAAADTARADGLLVFDASGVTGHPDHVAATSAAMLAATTLGLPVLAWTIPESVAAQLNSEFDVRFTGHRHDDIDMLVTVDRTAQHAASLAHASQAVPGSVLWRRLELLGDTESLRWLRPPDGAAGHDDTHDGALRVEHRGGDQFDVAVRGHVISVDQPIEAGGEDTAPTPTELFVASLASCVAFYARRYLARHDLPTRGLAVDATFDMSARPARVSGVDLRVILPVGVPPERRDALLAVASHCTVHNTLTSAPAVSITLAYNGAGPNEICGRRPHGLSASDPTR